MCYTKKKKQDLLSHPGVKSLVGNKRIFFIRRIQCRDSIWSTVRERQEMVWSRSRSYLRERKGATTSCSTVQKSGPSFFVSWRDHWVPLFFKKIHKIEIDRSEASGKSRAPQGFSSKPQYARSAHCSHQDKWKGMLALHLVKDEIIFRLK